MGKAKSKEGMGVVFLFKEGAENEFLKYLEDPEIELDLSKLIPIDYQMFNQVYGYIGTTTQPPCKTGVGWYILPLELTASKAQIDFISAKMNGLKNNRETSTIRTKRLFNHPPVYGYLAVSHLFFRLKFAFLEFDPLELIAL